MRPFECRAFGTAFRVLLWKASGANGTDSYRYYWCQQRVLRHLEYSVFTSSSEIFMSFTRQFTASLSQCLLINVRQRLSERVSDASVSKFSSEILS